MLYFFQTLPVCKTNEKKNHDHRRILFPVGSIDNPVQVFDGVLFFDQKQKKAVGLCQVGPLSQGNAG